LQGADLHYAQLQGADLRSAELEGADLREALQGTDLSTAQLQGADLTSADLSDSWLDNTFVFGADISDANLATATIGSIEAGKVQLDDASHKIAPLVDGYVEGWIAAATKFAQSEDEKAGIIAQFSRIKPDFYEDAQEPMWSGMQEASLALDPSGEGHRQRLAAFLSNLACDSNGAPYVAHGLVGSTRLWALGDPFAAFRARLEEGRKTQEKCPGVAGFTEGDWRALEAIKPD
jgi:hypothetical protein